MEDSEGDPHPRITLESYKDKTLVLAQGNIVLQVRGQGRTVPFADRIRDFMPAIAGVSLVTAISSAVMAYIMVESIRHEVAARFDEQNEALARLEAGLATAQSRSEGQTEKLMLRADVLGSKLDRLPDRIDSASHEVTETMSDSITILRKALTGLNGGVFHSSPILVIRKRKAGF